MKHFYTRFLPAFMVLASLQAGAQTTTWANSSSGIGDTEFGSGICRDTEGNIVTSGYFENIATFGEDIFVSAGNIDIVIQKFAPNGDRIWSKHFAGPGEDYAHAIATDSNNNIYVSGKVLGTVYFGSIAITGSNNNDNYYLVKLDPQG